jgi:hypothetical protein
VLASGNLGLLPSPSIDGRADRHQIDAAYPEGAENASQQVRGCEVSVGLASPLLPNCWSGDCSFLYNLFRAYSR